MDHHPRTRAFTLIELLTVVAIISLLISILMPSLGRAREQAKSVHCLARLKDMGHALAAYENVSLDLLPPAEWLPDSDALPDVRFGWAEILFSDVYREPILRDGDVAAASFPVQRNLDPVRWDKYFLCRASAMRGVNSGHYRVYLPAWATGTYGRTSNGTFNLDAPGDPYVSVSRNAISPRMVLIGDANERSYRGDGDLDVSIPDDCSYIDAGEANISGTDGADGNRFSDRHYGGTNFLFQDFHAEWSTKLRDRLARDVDLNGINDIISGS